MASKTIFTFLLLLKIAVVAFFIAFHVIDLKKGVSASWSFNNLFFCYLALPLLALVAFFELRMLADRPTRVKYLPAWTWLLCIVAAFVQPYRYYFETNIALLSIVLLGTIAEGIAFYIYKTS